MDSIEQKDPILENTFGKLSFNNPSEKFTEKLMMEVMLSKRPLFIDKRQILAALTGILILLCVIAFLILLWIGGTLPSFFSEIANQLTSLLPKIGLKDPLVEKLWIFIIPFFLVRSVIGLLIARGIQSKLLMVR